MNPKAKTCASINLALLLFFSSPAWADEADLVWSTFLGGSGSDLGGSIVVDTSGYAYLTGKAGSANFPTTAGAFDTLLNLSEVFVAKLNPTGSVFDYATFLGGSNSDLGWSIAIDDSGNAYVTGETESSDFPTTAGAFDTSYNGTDFMYGDVFVAKLDPTGSTLIYSTFLGGSKADLGYAIAVDNVGQAYLTGSTTSNDFPITAGAFDTTYHGGPLGGDQDAFMVKLNTMGSALSYATFLGGNGEDWGRGIALNDSGNAYVTGDTESDDFPTTVGAFDTTHNGSSDVFVAELNALGSALVYSTYLGGSDDEWGSDIALDNRANAYVTGRTHSTYFPTTEGALDPSYNGSYDGFVAKLNRTGSSFGYVTFLGGDGMDQGHAIAVDEAGNAYVTGLAGSGFPATTGAYDTTYNGNYDAFVTKLNASGSALDYATFLGGSDDDSDWWVRGDIALHDYGYVYVIGITASPDFPTTAGAFDTTYNGGSYDAFVAKLNLGGQVPVEPATFQAILPKTYALLQNYPNPFNASTEIRYQLPEAGHVTLRIFNTLGQQVRSMVDTDQVAGSHRISWDGSEGDGREVASGLYFCRLQTGDFSKTIKMVLIR